MLNSMQSFVEASRRVSQSVPALTRAGGLKPLAKFLDTLGVPVPSMLSAANLPPDLLADPNALIPLHFVHRFVETCASSQGVENLGAVVAERTSAFEMAVIGPSLRRAATVYDYLQTGRRVIGEVTSGERFWLTLEGDSVRFHHLAPGRPCVGSYHEDIFVILLTIRMLREFAGGEWSPGEVNLMTSDARMVGDLEVFGDADVHFGATHSSFTLSFELLHSPVSASVAGVCRDSGDLAPLEPVMPHAFLEGIEALVVSMLNAGRPNLDTISEAAGLSPRTLQRRLGDHGCSYSGIVRRSRIRQAREWLVSTDIPIHEIAYALGYSDPANFTRAFRRAEGVPPQEYRRPH